MEADSAICRMNIQTTNNAFWNQIAEDGYYKCDTETCGAIATAVANPAPGKIQTDSLKSDWTVPIPDNDPDKPLCTPYTAKEKADNPYFSQFACKEISCVIQRPLVTNDA